jgi:hypothetical protein
MAIRQNTAVRVPSVWQFGLAGVDLNHFAELSVPSQPPPLVTAMHGGNQGHVTAVMSGSELTSDTISFGADVLFERQHCRQHRGADTDGGRAAGGLSAAGPDHLRSHPPPWELTGLLNRPDRRSAGQTPMTATRDRSVRPTQSHCPLNAMLSGSVRPRGRRRGVHMGEAGTRPPPHKACLWRSASDGGARLARA